MKTPRGDIKHYLDYLDKEMTIQGVLSAFCMAAAGLVLDRVLGAEAKNTLLMQIQTSGWAFVVAGSSAIVLAGLLFYLQRSYLAMTLGKVASIAAEESAGPAWKTVPTATQIEWRLYQCAFAALILGGVEYAFALGSRYGVLRKHWIWWSLTPWLVVIFGSWSWFRFAARWQGATIVESLFPTEQESE